MYSNFLDSCGDFINNYLLRNHVYAYMASSIVKQIVGTDGSIKQEELIKLFNKYFGVNKDDVYCGRKNCKDSELCQIESQNSLLNMLYLAPKDVVVLKNLHSMVSRLNTSFKNLFTYLFFNLEFFKTYDSYLKNENEKDTICEFDFERVYKMHLMECIVCYANFLTELKDLVVFLDKNKPKLNERYVDFLYKKGLSGNKKSVIMYNKKSRKYSINNDYVYLSYSRKLLNSMGFRHYIAHVGLLGNSHLLVEFSLDDVKSLLMDICQKTCEIMRIFLTIYRCDVDYIMENTDAIYASIFNLDRTKVHTSELVTFYEVRDGKLLTVYLYVCKDIDNNYHIKVECIASIEYSKSVEIYEKSKGYNAIRLSRNGVKEILKVGTIYKNKNKLGKKLMNNRDEVILEGLLS